MEGFVPYPAYTTEDGFEIPEHPGFYGKGYGLDSTFTSVGQRTIRHYNNANFSGNQKDDDYECMMRVEDGVYYLKINGLAVYRFSNSSQRWEFEKADRAEANMITGLYANNNRKDVYLPGPGDDEFYTGFKDIANQANTEKRFANRIAVYKAYNGVAMLDDYKIAYYRKDNRYCVDIYTLDSKNLYRKYIYDEVSGQWESKGSIFEKNISYVRGGATLDFYIPTMTDTLEWFNAANTNNAWLQSSALKRYRCVNDSWSEFSYRESPTLWYYYDPAARDLRINFAYTRYDGIQFKYDFNNNTWVRQ